MDTFLANAEEILETAASRPGAATEAPGFTFLVAPDGGIHLIAGSDWPLDSLRREHGASAAYRVGRTGGLVWVEGRSMWRSCRLERPAHAAVARHLLGL